MSSDKPSTTSSRSGTTAKGTVHRIGEAEIQETRQGDITIFAVRGSHSPQLLSLMERILARSKGDIGLDLRDYQGPGRAVIGSLRKINRQMREKGRVFLLYEPPSKIVDQLRLTASLDEFNVFSEANGLVTAAGKEEEVEAEVDEAPDMASRSIVTFTQDLSRVEELESSLDTASQRSVRMLSLEPPEFDPFKISTAYYPHDKVGGDFVALVDLDEDRMGLTIGDVSGHGLEAALIMGMTRKVLDIRAREGSFEDPALVMQQVNRDIFPDLDRYTFVTAFYGIVDRKKNTINYARAGHNYPLLVSPSRKKILQLASPGIALGMDSGNMFDCAVKPDSEDFLPGDVLLIYTDGVTEAAHPRKGQFGLERVMQFFRETDLAKGPEEIKSALLNTIHDFVDSAPLQDDLTMILVKHNGD